MIFNKEGRLETPIKFVLYGVGGYVAYRVYSNFKLSNDLTEEMTEMLNNVRKNTMVNNINFSNLLGGDKQEKKDNKSVSKKADIFGGLL